MGQVPIWVISHRYDSSLS